MNLTSPTGSHYSAPPLQDRRSDGAPDGHAERSKPGFGVRLIDIAALNPDGSIVIGQRRVPTLPRFNQTFAAFAQGTLFQSECGMIAVEDLQPGDRLLTTDGTAEVITWIGAGTCAPRDAGDRIGLTRIMADSFGVNRPENFVSLGPAARLLQTPYALRALAGSQRMMTPAHAFVDGVNVIEVMPPTPIRLFHIAMRRHVSLIAGGLEVESYHPGPQVLHPMSHTLRSVFLSVFPHIQQIADFGTLNFPRAPEDDSQTAA